MRISDWSSDVCSSDLQSSGHEETRDQSWYQSCFRLDLSPLLGRFIHHEMYKPKIRYSANHDGSQNSQVNETHLAVVHAVHIHEIGRASCRERVCQYV